jgi:hypothetical protein
MSCCCGYHHHQCHHWGAPAWYEPGPPPSWHTGPWAGGGYLHRLEEERELLERRVRRLEQELADLRQAMRPAESSGEQR